MQILLLKGFETNGSKSQQFILSLRSKMSTPKKEYGVTKRNGRKLRYDRNIYTIDRTGTSGQTYWKCVDRKCYGRVIEYEDGRMVVKPQTFRDSGGDERILIFTTRSNLQVSYAYYIT
jgi:hypothetical protein